MQMFPFLFESICSASLSIVLLNELLRKQLSVKSQATPRDESRRDTPSALMFTAALRILLTAQFISHLQQMDSDKVCGQMERCMIYAHPRVIPLRKCQSDEPPIRTYFSGSELTFTIKCRIAVNL